MMHAPRRCRFVAHLAGLALAGVCLVVSPALAQPVLTVPEPPRPPGLIPNAPPPVDPAPLAPPAPVGPAQGFAPAAPAPARPPVAAPRVPLPPSATTRATLSLAARYGGNLGAIQNGIHWRVYSDRPDQTGAFRIVGESGDATPSFSLPPGTYVIHATYGLAGLTRKVTIGLEGARETLTIAAGGLRMQGMVGESRIPGAQVNFQIFRGSQFDSGDKRLIAEDVAQGDVVLLPEGIYHIVSNYGDTNAVVRSDVRVHAGRLSDATVHHRAASVTLKLVSDHGREALANTAWSVLTPGGDIIKESIGAFPVVILAEGDYVAIARNDGRTYQRDFKVDPGVDREVEVLAKDPGGPPQAAAPTR
jgi:hypothetical protein